MSYLNCTFIFVVVSQLSDKIGLSIKERIVCYERKLDSWVSRLIVDTGSIKLNGVCLLHSASGLIAHLEEVWSAGM